MYLWYSFIGWYVELEERDAQSARGRNGEANNKKEQGTAQRRKEIEMRRIATNNSN